LDTIARRLELLKLEGLGFSQAEIVNELSQKLSCSKRVVYEDFETRQIWQPAVVSVRMKAKYYRVSRLVVLPDYQGIGVGKRLLDLLADLYTSQTKMPFYILTSNPLVIRGNLNNWKITHFGHASKERGNSRINNEIRNSLSRKRVTISLRYIPPLNNSLTRSES
jgi:GNAT superfamily N-acetyltransferase